MTAESDVSALLSHATGAASSLAGSSSALVNAAVAVIQKTVRFPVPPPPTPSDSGISMGGAENLPDPKPGFPPWPERAFDPVPYTNLTLPTKRDG